MPSYQLLATYIAVESRRGIVSVNRPVAPVRVESIGPPWPCMRTWCSTTHAFASGRSRGPYSTCPETCTRCATSPPPPLNRQRRTSALWRELAEIFRIEVLQIRLEGVGVERGGAGGLAGFAGIHRREPQQTLAREDRGLEPQSHGDRIRRAGVDLNNRVSAVDVQLGEIGVVLDLGDDDLAEVGAEADDDLLQEVVGEGAGELHAGELHRDRARLGGADPDRQHPLPVPLLEDDDRRVGRAIEPEVGHPHPDPRTPGTFAVPA